jgi:hypothetical protein
MSETMPVTVDNEVIERASITGYGGQIHVNTPVTGDMKVYTIDGKLYEHRQIGAGATSLSVAKGLYIVVFGDRSVKVLVR